MRIKKRLLAKHIKKGYSIKETNGRLELWKNGEHVRNFAIYDTPQMIRRACEEK